MLKEPAGRSMAFMTAAAERGLVSVFNKLAIKPRRSPAMTGRCAGAIR
jgi:hypothetical protein